MSDQKWIVFCVFNSIVVALITGLVMANMVLPNHQKRFDRIEAQEFILKGKDGRTYARLGLDKMPSDIIEDYEEVAGREMEKPIPQLLNLTTYSNFPDKDSSSRLLFIANSLTFMETSHALSKGLPEKSLVISPGGIYTSGTGEKEVSLTDTGMSIRNGAISVDDSNGMVLINGRSVAVHGKETFSSMGAEGVVVSRP